MNILASQGFFVKDFAPPPEVYGILHKCISKQAARYCAEIQSSFNVKPTKPQGVFSPVWAIFSVICPVLKPWDSKTG